MFDTLRSGIDEVASLDVTVAPGSLGEHVPVLLVERNRLDAQIARILGPYEASGAWGVEADSCPAWLREQTLFTHAQARTQVKVARAQRRLPLLAGAWQAGKISYAHWQAVVDGLALLDVERWPEVDAPLAELAPAMTSKELKDYLTQLAQNLVPDPKPADERRKAKRRLFVSTAFDGMTDANGKFTPEVGEKLRTVLSSLGRPDAEGETRTHGQRQADAFEAALDKLLNSGELPHDGGRRPHLTLLVPLDRIDLASQLAEHDPTRLRQHTMDLTPAERADVIRSTTETWKAEQAHPGSRQPRFRWTGPVGVAGARRLLCDGVLTPVFTRGDKPLDAGRATRTVPATLRALIDVRDHECIWPGCHIPREWTEIHHLWFWADGGPTNADTLGRLCGHHHDEVHSGRWEVVVTAPGVIDPRPRTDPDQPLYRFEFDVADLIRPLQALEAADDPGDPTEPHLHDTHPDPHEHPHRHNKGKGKGGKPRGTGPSSGRNLPVRREPDPGQQSLEPD